MEFPRCCRQYVILLPVTPLIYLRYPDLIDLRCLPHYPPHTLRLPIIRGVDVVVIHLLLLSLFPFAHDVPEPRLPHGCYDSLPPTIPYRYSCYTFVAAAAYVAIYCSIGRYIYVTARSTLLTI